MASDMPPSMMQRLRPGWIVAASTTAVVVALVCLAAPTRHAVVGLSMAPGLLPGDVLTNPTPRLRDRGRWPRRFERWLFVAPSGTAGGEIVAVKRVMGLAGECVTIADGDLLIDGVRSPAPPDVVAQMASPVWEDGRSGRTVHQGSPGWTSEGTAWRRDSEGSWRWHPSPATIGPHGGAAEPMIDWLAYRHRVRDPRRGADAADAFVDSPILDDAAFAPAEHRRLLPVRDIGIAAVLRVPRTAAPFRSFARVGDGGDVRTVAAAASGPTRLAFVAGRLDGHLVAAAWTLPVDAPPEATARSPLPPFTLRRWSLASPWCKPTTGDPLDGPPVLEFGIAPPGAVEPGATVAIERLVVWRDVLHRPAEDGSHRWCVDEGRVFVLGDFPPVSRDSRHWGPIEAARLLNPVDRHAPAAVVREARAP
jgi:type IV secretory pathway protease TraF